MKKVHQMKCRKKCDIVDGDRIDLITTREVVTMKKTGILLAALVMTGTLLCQSVVLADGVEEKPYLSLGADLNKKEKATVLELLGVDEDELDEYTVVTVTNQDEHKYLDNYLSASVIGSRALSSVLVEKKEKGEGIDVTTKNITYCTEGMYENALTTAGIEDADVIVAGPFNITGTAALVGAMNAYEDMTGEAISQESKDAATNELVVTSELAEELEDSEKAEQFLALIKEVIGDCEEKMQIELTDEQRQQIAELMEKINDLDLDLDVLKQQASDIYDELSKLNINTEGFFAKIQAALSQILEYLSSLFS